jgi:hypothetical protein
MTLINTSTPSPAVPVFWTDDPLTQNVTKVKAVHMEELRSALEALPLHTHSCVGVNTGPGPNNSVVWTDDPVVADATEVKAAHYNELVSSIKQQDNHNHSYSKVVPDYIYASSTSYYDPTLTFLKDPAVTDVDESTASHWEQLRSFLEGFASHVHTVDCLCECQCTCQCTCTCTCTCTCQCECTCTCDCATMG